MILGVGIDLVDLERFDKAVANTPKLLDRLFTEAEREGSKQTLAGRFAAKEAFVKAMRGVDGLHWQEVVISKDASGAPNLSVSGETAAVASKAGIKNFHVSISHDAGQAVAIVIAEGGADA